MPNNESPLNPLPIYDQIPYLRDGNSRIVLYLNKMVPAEVMKDYEVAGNFLSCYVNSQDTYNAYRRDVERFLHWVWLIKVRGISHIKRQDILDYFRFLESPPVSWIMLKSHPRFLDQAGQRIPNDQWRPFLVRSNKIQSSKGHLIHSADYVLHITSMRSAYATLSSFYGYLVQEEYTTLNPVRMIQQRNMFIRRTQKKTVTRKLSKVQWKYIVSSLHEQVAQSECYERHLLLISLFFLLGLRISEVARNAYHTPAMGDFAPDHNGDWWFTTVGKGNKERDVAVPDEMLDALKRYRRWLGLSDLPARCESTPLVGKVRGNGGLSARQIRNLIQECFDCAIDKLKKNSLQDDADDLRQATVHWLRHTSISYDVDRNRPIQHVGDDAGHSSTSTTNRYVDLDRKKRHQSARDKQMLNKEA